VKGCGSKGTEQVDLIRLSSLEEYFEDEAETVKMKIELKTNTNEKRDEKN